jgi:hypothetical protein
MQAVVGVGLAHLSAAYGSSSGRLPRSVPCSQSIHSGFYSENAAAIFSSTSLDGEVTSACS